MMGEQEQQQQEELTVLAPTSLSGLQVRSLEKLSDEDFWQYAREAVHPISPVPPSAGACALCRLSCGPWLVPLDALREVIPFSHPCTPLPLMPHWMLGLVAWRGEVIAAIDLDAYLCALQAIAYTPPTYKSGMLLVARYENHALAFYVTALDKTLAVEPAQILPPTEQPLPTEALSDILLGRYADIWILDILKLVNSAVQQIGEPAS
jgi:chemotaxis signal transduction protein